MPAVFLSVAQCDILYDGTLAMAACLGTAGANVTRRVYPGTVHGFIEATGTVGAAIAERALADTGALLGHRLTPGSA